MMRGPSPVALSALELVKVLQEELAATRRLAILSLGVASTAIGATVALAVVC